MRGERSIQLIYHNLGSRMSLGYADVFEQGYLESEPDEFNMVILSFR